MNLQGKGWFVWQIARCEGGAPDRIADQAAAAGCSHVLIKVAERTITFGLDRTGRDLVRPVVAALRARGLQTWGWHYVYGDQPSAEADIAVRRCGELGLDGYVIDAEAEYKRPGMAAAARVFMRRVRAGLRQLPIALSSFRYPALHQQLPWREFLEHCDLSMPQVYWEQAHNPAQQLSRSVREFNDARLVGSVRPVVPTGSAYGVGSWRATPEDITRFYTAAVELGLPAANLYSWDYARAAAANWPLWEAAANFAWPAAGGQDMLERYAAALNSGDLDQVMRLYQPNVAHVTLARTLVGRDDLLGWYRELLGARLRGATFEVQPVSGQGLSRRFRWTAAGPHGLVADGDDTIGLRDGLIQYHYASFSVTPR